MGQPTARLNTDKRWGPTPSMRTSREGYRAEECYVVDTENLQVAMENAIGIPAYGQLHSSGTALLKVVEKNAEYIARRDDVNTNPPTTGGLTLVQVIYETPYYGGRLPLPEVGLKFTVYETGEETTTVRYGRDRTAQTGNPFDDVPIPEGVTKRYGTVQATVYTYVPLSSTPAFNTLNSLQREHFLNDAQIALPPVVGTLAIPIVPKECAMYVGYSLSRRGNTLEIQHRLELGARSSDGGTTGFTKFYYLEDAEGKFKFGPIAAEVYKSASFAGLW